MTPQVSIVIPTYNRANTIIPTLESVFAQTFTDYEIIVIDDGSTDDTEQVLAPYMENIRYIKQLNQGSAAARNHGMQLAEGKLIAFLDSDDLWKPDKLAAQVTYMDAHPTIGMSYTYYLRVTDDLTPIELIDGQDRQGRIYRDLLRGCEIDTSTVMMRDTVRQVVGAFDITFDLMQDVDYWIRIAQHFEIGIIPEILTAYRVHSGNKPKATQRVLDLRIKLLDKHFQDGHNLGFFFKHRTYGQFYVRSLQQWLAEGNLKLAQHYAKEGWLHLLLSAGGPLVLARVLFRTLLPPTLQARLRGRA